MKHRHDPSCLLVALLVGGAPSFSACGRSNEGEIFPRSGEDPRSSSTELNVFGTMLGRDSSVTLARTEDLQVDALWAYGERVVTIYTEERDLVGEWSMIQDAHSTSFAITDLASGGSHVVFVAGITDSGNDIVEEWNLDKQSGSLVVAATSGSSVIFEPPYVITTYRPARRPPRRRVVFEGNLTGMIIDIVAEPERRYVYGLLGDPGPLGLVPNVIYSFNVSSGQTNTVFSSTTHAALQHAFRGMAYMEHETLGRAVVLNALGTDIYWTVLFDSDADGVLEAASAYTREQLDDAQAPGWSSISG